MARTVAPASPDGLAVPGSSRRSRRTYRPTRGRLLECCRLQLAAHARDASTGKSGRPRLSRERLAERVLELMAVDRTGEVAL